MTDFSQHKDLPFEVSEYRRRIENTKASMAERGLDVLLAADPANMNYLTGYDGWSFYTPQIVAVSLEHEDPVCIVRGIDANGGKVTAFLDDDDIVGYPDTYVQSTERHAMDFMADELKRRGMAKGRIGVEMDAYYYTAASHAALARNLSDAELVDATSLVNWVRLVKSEAEIAYMRRAAEICERMMQRAYDVIEPGVRQCDAVAAIYDAQVRGDGKTFGGDYTSIVPMLPTGIGTSTPHLTWNDKPFVTGEATILELAGAHRHYHCPMARTLHLGKPPEKLAKASEVVLEGVAKTLDFIKPGVTCEEIEQVWRETIARHGFKKESRMGYSVGVNYPPDWGEHTLSIRPGDKTVMRPNMTMHLMPGLWKDDWGIEISECFRVTETGAETFCNFPRPLLVKG
ncbi:MAG: M24 family metallopeptidase [Rhodospirillales bacterium]